ncbi:hypothetical protein ACFS5M_02825 [Lacinutrix iliipiscaria]|uniref:Repeat protein (TIGR03806 family) n=1 Tax=Lacinutrix iliipiscaria TaxID=1230532 RepID=A0ABW5WJX9_9FLAO
MLIFIWGMFKKLLLYILFIVLSIGVFSCASDDNYIPTDPVLTSPVVFNITEVPYPTLSEYNFFEGDINALKPVYGVLPYDLNSALFSDYAKKKRFVWMPEEVNAQYVNDYTSFDFPLGTVLIKNFYYENVQPSNNTKILETRLMIKKETEWEFAKYVWNDEQTEANLTSDGRFVALDWIQDGSNRSVNYRIPSHAECFTCHNKFGTPVAIGPKPQNLNMNYTYPEGNQNQLQKWINQGYLEDNLPTNITTSVNWQNESESLESRARSYIDINCAHCHSDESYCGYRPMRFAFNENNNLINMGVCVEPETNIDDNLTHIITPNSPQESVVYFRMSSTEEQYRMPLLGRTLQHREGVRLIEEYINSLINDCE